MSKENDPSQEPWEESEEESDAAENRLRQKQRQQRSSRGAFEDPSARQKQRPQQAGGSREAGRDRPGTDERQAGRRPGSNRANEPGHGYDAYDRPRQGKRSYRDANEYTSDPHADRQRQTRDFHERPDPYDEIDARYHQQHRIARNSREAAEARLRQRQRQRQPEYHQDEVNDAYMLPQQRNRYDTDHEVQEFDGRAYRPRPRAQSAQIPAKRQRGVLSTLLIGCAGGLITIAIVLAVVAFVFLRNVPVQIGGIGKSSFSKQLPQQSLPITANVTQFQIHNRVGNISIMVDPSATQATLSGVMKVQAANSSDAAKEFGSIKVDVSPSSDQSALVVNATVPDTSSGLLASSSDSVDLTIVLPPSVNPSPPFKLAISANIQAIGNISVQNFNGLLTLTDNTGNIAVTGGLQSEGSCLQTNVGNTTFAGNLVTGQAADTGLIPCTTNTSQNSHPWFSFKSGTGNVNVTLSAVTSNLKLDANTNSGKINSGEFGLNVQQTSDGSASYFGPLTPGTTPTALLALTVSTGDINLHKGV